MRPILDKKRGYGWVGSSIGEAFIEFQREYSLHGASRAAFRFVRGVFAWYSAGQWAAIVGSRWTSWDDKSLMKSFYESLGK